MTAAFFITVDDSHVQGILAKLQERTSAAGVRSWLVGTMYPFLRGRIMHRFATEGTDHAGWQQLADATIHYRERQGFPGAHPINVRTSGMMSALLSSHRIAGGDTLQVPGPLSRLNEEKLTTAQLGHHTPSTPARPVLELTDVDRSFAMDGLMAWITSGGV